MPAVRCSSSGLSPLRGSRSPDTVAPKTIIRPLMNLAPDEQQQPDAAAWEPTVSIVISGVTAVAGILGLVIAAWVMTGPRDGGMERLGEFILLMAAMGGTLAATAVGMIAAGVGLIRSNNRGVRTPSLKVTFVANLAEFALVFLLPSIMGRV